MSDKLNFRKAAEVAVQNIIRYGDTDIFPLPFENHAIFDKPAEFVDLICEYDDNFDAYMAQFPPAHVNSLAPVSYTGFRWATQLDPAWNGYFLSCVLVLAESMEKSRIPKNNQTVFSYRFEFGEDKGDLFDRNYGWFQFMERSLELADQYSHVTICDISEFYPRLGHHRLETALKQIDSNAHYSGRIMGFLSNFSNTRSFSLPIGGPAARILSELTINQIDKLLQINAIPFVRFADDFHIFSSSREESYKQLMFLSEKLFENQGLSLQKSKTRIMTAKEFKTTSPVAPVAEDGATDIDKKASTQQFLQISLRFDPYSPTAEEDYERLKEEVRKYDILGLLKEEIAKSRIHVALSRKLLHAIRYLEGTAREDAVLSVLYNSDTLYPIYASAMLMIDQLFDGLHQETQGEIIAHVRKLISEESHVFRVDITLCCGIRVLRNRNSVENQILLQRLYDTRMSPIVRRDIILTMASWSETAWLSDMKNKFRQLAPSERRAMIVASYRMPDEGSHWRKAVKREFSPLEKLIHKWASDRVGQGKGSFPL